MSRGEEGGPRGGPQAPHKHPLGVELLAPPPPFHVVVWVVGHLLVLPKFRGGIHFLFAAAVGFLIRVQKWARSDIKW